MSDIVLSVENLWKQYRLGLVGSGTLRDDVARWIAKLRGKEDPTLKIGAANTLNEVAGDYVWALQDINFEVKQGEVLGIIGKNGAGKSTLLKILSKVTAPTKGQVKVKGRIASLLEVGTGFHPELTGRENIFLNGAILGMNKAEIRRKLDEIIDFAGVAKYIDTPVKRYSSGMRVRLGFAVAAFLEPEILVVDEVLAVGDAEFQKKAIGKMQDVSKSEGRTVLFVSHNMNAVSTLTTKCLVLKNGNVHFLGQTSDAIGYYLKSNFQYSDTYKAELANEDAKITEVMVQTSLPNNFHDIHKKLTFTFKIEANRALRNAALAFQIVNYHGVPISHLWLFSDEIIFLSEQRSCILQCVIPKSRLYIGDYSLKVFLAEDSGRTILETLEGVCPFKVQVVEIKRDFEWQPDSCTYLEDFYWTQT
ncbi:MAG: polysaccharide ABC transporter ATP-binding protein [Microscillaceae bacterium]|nr:polysaccharide ABC transporter ATP-binding protein [Microscillaceae bacterium]